MAPYSVELRCSKSNDGKYSARTFIDGKERKEKGFLVNRSDEYAVVLVYQLLRREYPDSAPIIKGLDKHAMEMIQRTNLKK
jgi:hypothetical protein